MTVRLIQLEDICGRLERGVKTLGLTLLLVLVAGCVERTARAACFQLQEIDRFGHAEPSANGVDVEGFEAGAGVLGDIRGMRVGPDGTLFVLDRAWQKVVAYAPDGTVDRIILGGLGEGPGEFGVPIDMSLTSDGISVLDYDLRRRTTFNWSGEFLEVQQLPVPSPFRHLINGDTLWIARGGATEASGPFIYSLARPAWEVVEGPSFHIADQPFGYSVGMARGDAGNLLVTTARPGVWMVRTVSGAWERRGRPLYPEDQPPRREQVQPLLTEVSPSQFAAAGIGMIGDSLVVQGWRAFARPFDVSDPPSAEEQAYSIGVFDPEGAHLASMELPFGVVPLYLHAESQSGRLFMTSALPFPQVIEYRLSVCGA